MNIGNRILEIRKRYNLSQAKFALALKVTPSAVGMWERNERTPKHNQLTKISKQYGVSAIWLQHGDVAQNNEINISDIPIIGNIEMDGYIVKNDNNNKSAYSKQPMPIQTVAAILNNDLFHPIIKRGAIFFWSELFDNIDNFIDELVVCHLQDGRKVLRIIKSGRNKGAYNPASLQFPLIENVQISSVSPIKWIKPATYA